MSGFIDFVQTELPKRPYTNADGTPGQVAVRSNNAEAPREMVFVDAADLDRNEYSRIPTNTPISGHRVIAVAPDGFAAYADHDDMTTIWTIAGVALGAVDAGGTVVTQSTGKLIEPSWNWVPGPVFVGQNGYLTQVQPTTGYSYVVGIAVSAHQINLGKQPPIIL